jgi:hypothetical protein
VLPVAAGGFVLLLLATAVGLVAMSAVRADREADDADTASPRLVVPFEAPTPPRRPTPTVPLPSATLTVFEDGCGVIRSEVPAEVQNLTWSVRDLDGFQVLGRNAEGELRYRYFRSGTYTVTLEAWDGRGYAPMSNTVTISC